MMHQWQVAVEKMQAEEQMAEANANANAASNTGSGLQGECLKFYRLMLTHAYDNAK